MLYEEIEAMFEGLGLELHHRAGKAGPHDLGPQPARGEVRGRDRAGHQRGAARDVRRGEIQREPAAGAAVRALLHDIGKIGVPEAVLEKRNKLLDSEVREIEYRMAY